LHDAQQQVSVLLLCYVVLAVLESRRQGNAAFFFSYAS